MPRIVLALVVLAALVAPAAAHPLDVGYVRIEQKGDDLAVATLLEVPADVPFLAVFDGAGRSVTRPVGFDAPAAKQLVEIARTAIEPVRVALPGPPIAATPWPDPVTDVFVVPIAYRGAVVFGLSPRLPFDDPYRDFLAQAAVTITQAQTRIEIAEVRAASEAQLRNLLL